MPDPKEKQFWDEVTQFLAKVGVWAVYIVPTIIAKLAWDRNKGKLSWMQILVKVIVCLFIGYFTATICENYGWQKQGRLAVPVATLWSDSLMNLIMSKQEQVTKAVEAWLPKWLKKNKPIP